MTITTPNTPRMTITQDRDPEYLRVSCATEPEAERARLWCADHDARPERIQQCRATKHYWFRISRREFRGAIDALIDDINYGAAL